MDLEKMSAQELIAVTLAENYLMFGFADDGEADKVAARVVDVLRQFGWRIVSGRTETAAEGLERIVRERKST